MFAKIASKSENKFIPVPLVYFVCGTVTVCDHTIARDTIVNKYMVLFYFQPSTMCMPVSVISDQPHTNSDEYYHSTASK